MIDLYFSYLNMFEVDSIYLSEEKKNPIDYLAMIIPSQITKSTTTTTTTTTLTLEAKQRTKKKIKDGEVKCYFSIFFLIDNGDELIRAKLCILECYIKQHKQNKNKKKHLGAI